MKRVVFSCPAAVLAILAASTSLARAETMVPADQWYGFDCSVVPLALDRKLEQALVSKIARRWNPGMPSTETLQSKVTIRVCLSEAGRPENLILLAGDGPSKEAVDRLFETARRAILRADQDGGLPLPPDMNDTWRVLDLVFDANGKRAR